MSSSPKICSGIVLGVVLKIPAAMCPSISTGFHPENPTCIPPEILASLLEVTKAKNPYISSGLRPDFLARIFPYISPALSFSIILRIHPRML